ncbi:MAG: hypothetical protein NT178_16415 [Proteobacteria bacterium]|nr:hypothetical protein [Pseudomonadota bacterium]
MVLFRRLLCATSLNFSTEMLALIPRKKRQVFSSRLSENRLSAQYPIRPKMAMPSSGLPSGRHRFFGSWGFRRSGSSESGILKLFNFGFLAFRAVRRLFGSRYGYEGGSALPAYMFLDHGLISHSVDSFT